MKNSMRSVLCVVCLCPSVPLFGMERLKMWVGIQPAESVKKLTIEDKINQIADEFDEKSLQARMAFGGRFYPNNVAVLSGIVGGPIVAVGAYKLLDKNIFAEDGSAELKKAGAVVSLCSIGTVLSWYVAREAAIRYNARKEGLQALRFAEIDAEFLKVVPEILSVQVDKSKLTNHARWFLEDFIKRAEARKVKN